MKKFCSIIAILLIASISTFILVSTFVPDVMKDMDLLTYAKIFSIMIETILPLILISRSSLLLQRDTKANVAKIGMWYSIFYIVIIILTQLNILTSNFGAETILIICTAFLLLLIAFTFIFETNSTNKGVTIYQYLIAFICTGLIIYLLYNSISNNNLSFNNTTYVSSILIIIVLLIMSIPLVNLLIDKEPTESNEVDLYLQNIRREQEKEIIDVNNTDNSAAPILETKPEIIENKQTIIPDAFDIPIINTPVSVNEEKKEESNNINPSL